MKRNLKIYLKDGDVIVWNKCKYDSYIYQGGVFIVIADGEWVGIYNMDSVLAIEARD